MTSSVTSVTFTRLLQPWGRRAAALSCLWAVSVDFVRRSFLRLRSKQSKCVNCAWWKVCKWWSEFSMWPTSGGAAVINMLWWIQICQNICMVICKTAFQDVETDTFNRGINLDMGLQQISIWNRSSVFVICQFEGVFFFFCHSFSFAKCLL